MERDWFDGWVTLHCQATGANAEAAASLRANRRAFVDDWHSTPEELGECTHRLISRLRVPKWPNEHAEAVGRELNELRYERAAAGRVPKPDPVLTARIGTAPRPAECHFCNDTGFVPVPHPLCVERPADGPPRIACYPGTRTVYTGVALCDQPDCLPGRRVRDADARADKRRATLSGYLWQFRGANALALFAEYERGLLTVARRLPDFGGKAAGRAEFAAIVHSIKARMEEGAA